MDLNENFVAPKFRYDFTCIGPKEESREEYLKLMAEGNVTEAEKLLEVKWQDTAYNTVTNTGRNDILDKYFAGSAYTAAWYLGLKGTGSAAASDTLASHAGWSEVTPYSGNRPAISWSAASSQSKTASAAVSYSINATATVAGAFICTVNSGTSGTLYSAGDFAASRSVASGDTLNVTPTVSA